MRHIGKILGKTLVFCLFNFLNLSGLLMIGT